MLTVGWLGVLPAGRLCDTELSMNLQEARVHVFERVCLHTIHKFSSREVCG